MAITTLSSREFNQDASGAKKAAKQGPVFITDRGRPAHVLLSIDDYQRLAGDSEKSPTHWPCRGPKSSILIRLKSLSASGHLTFRDFPSRHQRHF